MVSSDILCIDRFIIISHDCGYYSWQILRPPRYKETFSALILFQSAKRLLRPVSMEVENERL